MHIDRRYRSRYRRRSRWPLYLLLLALAGSLLYAALATGVLKMDRGRAQVSLNPRNPFKPTLPSPTPTRTSLSYLAEAEDHYKAGKLTEASVLYARAAELEPRNDEPLQWQAWLMILRGRPAEAVPLARKAVQIKDSAMNLGVLAMALDWSEQYDEAMETALKAIDKDPLSAEAHAFLAEVYADKNNWTRSYDSAQTAVKLNPDSPIAQRNLGYVLERQGRYKDALAAYEKAGQLAPYMGYIYISAGNTYLAMGEYDAALPEFQKAADANPDSPAGYDALGHASAVAGDPDRAIATLKKALLVDPNYGPAHAHLGSVYYTRLNYEAAVESFKKAVDLGVRSEEYFYEFGLCYVYLDDCQNATIWLKKALEMNPDSKPARDGLQLCVKG